MDKILEVFNKLKLWQILVTVGVVLFGLGFTGAVGVLGLTLISGMERLAIGVGTVMIIGAVYLREAHRDEK